MSTRFHDARQRLTRLEIEAHRIKAELARLESENEDEIADELTQGLWPGGVDKLSFVAPALNLPRARPRRLSASPFQPAVSEEPMPSVAMAESASGSTAIPRRPLAKSRRIVSPAWMLSLGAHLAILAALVPMTFVVLSDSRPPLLVSMFDAASEHLDQPEVAPIELVSYEEVVIPDGSAGRAGNHRLEPRRRVFAARLGARRTVGKAVWDN